MVDTSLPEMTNDGLDEAQSIKAYRTIRAAIAELEFRPGQPLSEALLSERFGFGRMPVREAVHRLRHDGLLISVPRKGLFVKPLELEDVREIYEMLEALDGMVVKLVAPIISAADLAALEELVAGEERALQADDQEGWIKANRGFHQRLVAVANNRRIATAIELLEEQVSRATRLTYPMRPKPFASVEEHRGIIRALRAGEFEQAQQLNLKHRERVRLEILAALGRVNNILGSF